MKDIITVFLAFMSFLMGGMLVYWRENRKLFQEKIFEQKFNAYREIFEHLGMYYEDAFNFLDYYQDYEKSEQEWLIDAQPHFAEHYAKAYKLKNLYYKNLPLLPESQLVRLDEIISKCISHITHHAHFNTSLPHESYIDLYNAIMLFAEDARKELSINILNVTLNRRLVESFYPISLPKKRYS